jgi:hypothetical protein
MSYTPKDALKWVVREMENHTCQIRQLVGSATRTPMPAEHLKCVILKISELADWLDKVSILCFEVVEKDGSNHPDDNIIEEEFEAAREIQLERLPTPETLL